MVLKQRTHAGREVLVVLLINTGKETEEEQSAGFIHSTVQDVVLHVPCTELCQRHRALRSGVSWLLLSELTFWQALKV